MRFRTIAIGAVLLVLAAPFLYGFADVADRNARQNAAAKAKSMTDAELLAYAGGNEYLRDEVKYEILRRGLTKAS